MTRGYLRGTHHGGGERDGGVSASRSAAGVEEEGVAPELGDLGAPTGGNTRRKTGGDSGDVDRTTREALLAENER